MTSPLPAVLEGIDLPGFVQHVLDVHKGTSTIIVCSTKDAFVERLQAALNPPTPPEAGESATGGQIGRTLQGLDWETPTLRLLATSRTVRLVFCPELTHLRAYLSTYAYRHANDKTTTSRPGEATDPRRILAILNPIELHRPTSSPSAQGINRTFAIAVEASYYSGSQLLLAELPAETEIAQSNDAPLSAELYCAAPDATSANPWDEEVSILNVTTKSFGAGERGWVGRTVKVRRIAGRWCRFQDVNLDQR